MRKNLLSILAVWVAGCSLAAHGETLAQYVAACKSELGFTTIPDLDCYKGALFDPSVMTVINDYVGHARATDNDDVDVVFACRWLFGSQVSEGQMAQSIELTVHNRQTGGTCFFKAKDDSFNKIVSPAIVSPTSANAANYWESPFTLDATTRCVDCHVAGPYIASPKAAPYMAKFGLLNDTHDTRNNSYHAVGSDLLGSGGSAFLRWDGIVRGTASPGCAAGCHQIATSDPLPIRSDGGMGQIIIRPISRVITEVLAAGLMPANNGPFNDYRWVNMDSPAKPLNGDDGEFETLIGLQQHFPNLACSNPAYIEAHKVDGDIIFDNYPYGERDKLATFNLRDGLVCNNSDQSNGKRCNDYETSYLCNGAWTDWRSTDSNNPRGDSERRSAYPGLCPAPTAIQARFFVDGGVGAHIPVTIRGPNDRLREFDSGGLRCSNADQGSGQKCSDYVVRFICDGTSTTPVPARPGDYKVLRTERKDLLGTGRYTYLSAGGTGSDPSTRTSVDNEYFHSGWTSQQWVIEKVTDFSNFTGLKTLTSAERSNAVRLKNVWTRRYLTVDSVNIGTSTAPAFALRNATLRSRPYSGSQLWIRESLGDGSGSVRLGSAWLTPSPSAKVYATLQTGANQDKGTQNVLAQRFDGLLSTQKWVIQ